MITLSRSEAKEKDCFVFSHSQNQTAHLCTCDSFQATLHLTEALLAVNWNLDDEIVMPSLYFMSRFCFMARKTERYKRQCSCMLPRFTKSM